ncbi:hypothetical protein F1C58_03015 [Glaciihabitans sp. INWT7]|uniref:hypothetical protein n=1 Tax=Glaciihabitans sp. INWT7 TaxID=2596912 RepID=UPI00162948A5|nr:hypothetical protein [Glaciihabitans sp. INWT7]QNE45983.1 hypothetical protein F1C58_03015 [Glaciihabitans sp. INWT7]
MKSKYRIVAIMTAAVLVASILPATAPAHTADAAVGSQFNAGMIISDSMFYDGGAMSIETAQNFLNSKVRSCQAGYTCLKDYRQDTPSRAAVAGRCAAYQGLANESAAQIIARVGAACGISQRALIVLLEKEEGLVTSTAPSAGRYKIATGFGCPDTAACDSTYYGFFNQLWAASLQFKIYLTSPGSFNIRAGRVNQVRWSPNAACGASAVFVQNSATAGLYNYTPYQPNAAALGNMYGTGDACSSYGNRNFWALFTDWFGATTASSMLRTAADPTVYMVVGTNKYPVTSFAVYNAFAPLGPASIVSQTYLDTLTTGRTLGRIVRGPDGAIYFIDAAIKLQFTSCAQVVDYGGSCAADGYVNMTDAQVAAFHTGPYVTPVLGTQGGPRYWLSAGVKHEVLDNASQSAAGIVAGFNVLTEAALADLPFGPPVVRDSVYVGQRGTGEYFYLGSSKKFPLAPSDVSTVGAAARAAGSLRAESLALIASGASNFTGAVTAPASTTPQVLSAGGRYASVLLPSVPTAAVLPASQAFVDSYADLGTLPEGSFVKSPIDASVFVTTPTALRPVGGWDALVAIANTANPTILSLPGALVSGMAKGPLVLGPGNMYRTTGNPQIFLLDGLGGKIPVGNFDYTTSAGFTMWSYATAGSLDSYALNPSRLTFGIQCGSTKSVSVGGALRPVDSLMQSLFPFTYVQLDPLTCAHTTTAAPAINFIRTADGAIYQIAGGQRHHVGASTFAALNAGKGWMQVPFSFAASIPLGANV